MPIKCSRALRSLQLCVLAPAIALNIAAAERRTSSTKAGDSIKATRLLVGSWPLSRERLSATDGTEPELRFELRARTTNIEHRADPSITLM
jgi:hypothetical protein